MNGARQVGKTYIINKFADENFRHKIYINLFDLSGKQFMECYKKPQTGLPVQNDRSSRFTMLLNSSIRFEDTSILDFVRYACAYFFMRQQFFEWRYEWAGRKEKRKKEAEKRLSTRQFIGAKEITDYSLVTYGQGELVYFIVKPTNISVLSESSVGARI